MAAQTRPNVLRCTESIKLMEDEDSIREEKEARRQIMLHLMHNGFTEEARRMGNTDWHANHMSVELEVARTRGRRSGSGTAVSGFAKDVIAGLHSSQFSLCKNVDHDARPGLDDESAKTIAEYMEAHGCSFDEARLQFTRMRMRQAGVDPDTGLPLDPKALLPEDHCPPAPVPPKSPKLMAAGGSSQSQGTESVGASRLSAARQLITKMWGGGGSA